MNPTPTPAFERNLALTSEVSRLSTAINSQSVTTRSLYNLLFGGGTVSDERKLEEDGLQARISPEGVQLLIGDVRTTYCHNEAVVEL